MLSPAQKDSYWRTVEACMVELMGIDPAVAYRKVQQHRDEVSDLFYQREPINTAADLAGVAELSAEEYQERYKQIVARFDPVQVIADFAGLSEIMTLRPDLTPRVTNAKRLQQLLDDITTALSEVRKAVGQLLETPEEQ